MAKVTLVGLHFSPWTERARWALDHHQIRHAFEHYLPVVGEPMLRVRARRFSGRLSVPVLFTPHGSVGDSLAIAKHADSIGKGDKLVDGHEGAVARFVDVAERALDAARGLVLHRLMASPRAQEESVSLPLPNALKRSSARLASAVLIRKWRSRLPEREAEARVAEALDELRRALDGKSYLDGAFSFADIAMAGVLQTIQPVSDRFLRLAPGTREVWTRPALASRYADLVAWRDALYEKHRQPS